jgi:hypothetical protein
VTAAAAKLAMSPPAPPPPPFDLTQMQRERASKGKRASQEQECGGDVKSSVASASAGVLFANSYNQPQGAAFNPITRGFP